MWRDRYFCPILTRFAVSGRILMKVPFIKLHDNPFVGSRAGICGRTDINLIAPNRTTEQVMYAFIMCDWCSLYRAIALRWAQWILNCNVQRPSEFALPTLLFKLDWKWPIYFNEYKRIPLCSFRVERCYWIWFGILWVIFFFKPPERIPLPSQCWFHVSIRPVL